MTRWFGAVAASLMAALLSFSPAQALTLYTTGNAGAALFTIDSSTGAGTLVGNFGHADTYSLAFDPGNTLYAIVDSYNTSTLATVDTTTGAATPIGSGTNIADLMAMVFAPDGTLYAASWGTDSLYTMDPTTGAATVIGALGFSGVMDLAFDGSGTLYGIASMGSSSALYTIDPATGAGTMATTASNNCLMSLTIDPTARFLSTDYCVGNSPLYQVDPSTGTVTSLGDTGIASPMGLTYRGVATAVPEPASMALLAAGLAGLTALRRKRA
ncbi:MAG: hypothetical protein BGP12_01745 [Rhodospirillales bacterium 70-18]|nr:PEP-CTERM sorting domain-containing protein [Rhodospirillales bacterium]OJY76240.1 MAG: hypothetical protein BGP12_01745 [Rhodospirillales bacterium 70-18]